MSEYEIKQSFIKQSDSRRNYIYLTHGKYQKEWNNFLQADTTINSQFWLDRKVKFTHPEKWSVTSITMGDEGIICFYSEKDGKTPIKQDERPPSTNFNPASINHEQYYSFLTKLEKKSVNLSSATNLIKSQEKITHKLRTELIDLYHQATTRWGLCYRVLFRTVNITDRYIDRTVKKLTEQYYRSVFMIAFALAIQYETDETLDIRKIAKFVQIEIEKDKTELLKVEQDIVQTINFEFYHPVVVAFFPLFTQVIHFLPNQIELMYHLAKLSLLDVRFTNFYPSVIANCCLYLATGKQYKECSNLCLAYLIDAYRNSSHQLDIVSYYVKKSASSVASSSVATSYSGSIKRVITKLEKELEDAQLRDEKLEDTKSVDDISMELSTLSLTTSKAPYQIEEQINSGVYGTVYYVSFPDGQHKAIKRFDCANDSTVLPSHVLRELSALQLLKQFNHPNIIDIEQIVTTDLSDYRIDAVMPIFPHTLHKYCRSTLNIGFHSIQIIMRGILQGLECIHRAGLVHLDLKTENILLDEDNCPRIIDFGLVEDVNNSYSQEVITITYRSPELLLSGCDRLYMSDKVDIWSAGCILGELLTGRYLFCTDIRPLIVLFSIFKFLGTPVFDEKNFWPNFPGEFSEFLDKNMQANLTTKQKQLCYDLLSKLLKYDPLERLSASEALKHPFFD